MDKMDFYDCILKDQLGHKFEVWECDEIFNDWKCFVCKSIPEDPVKLRECRHSYCYQCISKVSNCPKCGARFSREDLKSSMVLSEYSTLSNTVFQSIYDLSRDHNHDENAQEVSDADKANKGDIILTPPALAAELVNPNPMDFSNTPDTVNTACSSTVKPREIPTTAIKSTKKQSLFLEIKAGPSSTPESRADCKTYSYLKRTKAGQSRIHKRRKQSENKQGITPRCKSVESKFKTPEVEKRNIKGETALHSACVKKDLERVQSLLDEGANPNVKDFAGWTPLTEAVNSGSLQLVEILLQHGAWVNAPAVLNTTALLEAVCRKNTDMIDLLLKHGADVNIRSKLNNSPLSLAADDETLGKMLLNRQEVQEPEEILPPFSPETIPKICCGVTKCKENNIFQICEELKFEVKSHFWNDASHIVTETDAELNCECSLNVLQGICAGISIVSTNWLSECLKTKSVVPIDGYEVKGTKNYPGTGVPRISRLSAYRLNPKLFDGCHISLTGSWLSSGVDDFSKKDLVSLIRDSGAVYLLRDPDPEGIPENEGTIMFHCKIPSPMASVSHVILYQPNSDPKKEPLLKYNMKHVKTLPLTWYLKCIQTFSICDP